MTSRDELSAPAEEEQRVEEGEIMECIHSSLTFLGRGLASAVQLNWSAIDRKKQLGILGNPRGFRTSLYGLFGEEHGLVVEAFLTKKLKERFPDFGPGPAGGRESDFVSVILWLRERVKSLDTLDERHSASQLTPPAITDSVKPIIDTMSQWFDETIPRVRDHIRALAGFFPDAAHRELEKELNRIESDFEDAVGTLADVIPSSDRKEQESMIAGVFQNAGDTMMPDSNLPSRSRGPNKDEPDTLLAMASVLTAGSELDQLNKRVQRIIATGKDSATISR